MVQIASECGPCRLGVRLGRVAESLARAACRVPPGAVVRSGAPVRPPALPIRSRSGRDPAETVLLAVFIAERVHSFDVAANATHTA